MRSGNSIVSSLWKQLIFHFVVWVYVREKGGDSKTNFQVDLGITDTQYGLVSGFVYTYTNVLAAIILGYQVDSFNRKIFLFSSCFAWNIVCGLAYWIESFGQMCAVRMGFAVLSAVHTPACISLIGDMFEHEDRSKANSVYVAAISFGVGLASLTNIINHQIGWRNCALVVSGVGVCISFLGLTIYEPTRTSDRGNQM
jgi:MFS family permease